MSPIVKKHDGFIDKFIGDGIMAVFESADSCVNCAIEMLSLLPEYNKARSDRGRIPINMGIGIHTGHVIAGIIGDPERLEATVLGDKVNTASRLEQITKNYSVDIVASKEVVDSLGPKVAANVRFIDKVKLYGKGDSMEIFEIAKANETNKFFDSGSLKQIRDLITTSKFSEAINNLEPLLKTFPADPIIQMYFEMSKDGLAGKPLPVDIKGNHVFLKKVS
jgi:class 3 adenylate cyclase